MTTTPPEVNVDDLRRRARRRLIGAIVLALAAAVFVPMLLESDPKPLGEDVSVRIPPVDDGKFVNRLNDKGKSDGARAGGSAKVDAKSEPAKGDAPRSDAPTSDAGRSDAKEAPRDAAKDAAAREAAARDTAAATAALNGESPKDAAATEPPKDAVSAAPRRTLAEAEQKMLGAPAKAVAPAPAPTAAGAGGKAPDAGAATAKAPSAASVPATPSPAAATPPAASADAAAPAFSVQLAAFADDKGANSLANKLKKAGYPAYTEPLTTSRGTLWRVRVGPYASREAAAAGRDKLKGEGYSGIVAPSK